ncbi:Neprilysin-1, partial [Orchesella cincta]
CQDTIPGRPTWQFSGQHWKLLELRNLGVNGGHKNPDSITSYDPDICYTDECLDAAKEYMISTNFSANPCEPSKWLNYVCNRRTQYPVLDRLNQFQDLMLLADQNTIDMMKSTNLTEPALKKAQSYFRQCVTWYSKNDPSKIDDIVKHLGTLGTWPLLTGADSPGISFDWRTLYATTFKVLQKGVSPYLFEVSSVGHNRTHIPTLFDGQKNFGMMKDEIIEIIKTLSKGSRMLTITDSQLLEMEDFFANLNRARFERSRSKAGPLQKIQDYYNSQAGIPKFDFTAFLQRIYNGTGMPITPNMLLGTDLDGIQRYIKVIEEASPRVLANVLFLQLAVTLLSQTSDLTNDPFIFPSLTAYQIERKYDPEAACAAEVQSKFDYALSHEYSRRFYEVENTREVQKMFGDLRKGYVWLIRQTGWIGGNTKSFLIDKANSIQPFIAFEDWVKDSGRVNDYYNDLQTSSDRDDFIDSYVTASQFIRSREIGLLHKGSPNVFSYPAGNAYAGSISPVYSGQFNQIKIPAGAIQRPVFSHKNPGYMNYAALGAAVAHELGHTFDSVGVHLSKDGKKGDYWDWLSYELYNKWKQILIEDYNSPGFRVEEPRGNYATTCQDHAKVIDEDIADLTGLYIVYLGYQQYLRDLRNSWKQEPKLPGLKNFSPEQLFWMKYGNSWCEHPQTLLVDPRATTKGHSPGNTRATLPIKRFRYWARAFNCPNPNIQDFY